LSDSPGIPDALIAALRDARRVFVLTGAGTSAESGVPTFRDAQSGLWEKYDPLDLATPEAFLRDPELIWNWYRWRRELVAKAEPNPGHVALAQLATLVPELTLVTQNVDGLHQQAGSCDVFLSIGTSSLVYPAAGLAELAKKAGAIVAEINPNPTGMAAGFDFVIAGKSGEILPPLIELLR